MPISSSDLKYRLSGGAANAAPLASLGGAKSSVDMPIGIFDDLTSAQALAGLTEYRCFYLHNDHGTLTALIAKIWLQSNTANTRIAIGLGASAINGTEADTGSETVAPAGVTFSTVPVSLVTGLEVGDIPPGQHKAVWLRRTVAPGATVATDSAVLRVQCDTNP